MPTNALKSLADDAGVSMEEAEAAWDKAKAAAKEEYPELSEDDDKFWAIVTSITKKMIGLKESSNTSFLDLCESTLTTIPTTQSIHDYIQKYQLCEEDDNESEEDCVQKLLDKEDFLPDADESSRKAEAEKTCMVAECNSRRNKNNK